MKISACSIVKNEESNIARSIESYIGVVDEIIIVDTGSTDNTVNICKGLGAKVFIYEWKNNFSAAKNYALEQATGEWIIFLDADEWFVPKLTKKTIYEVLRQIENIADALMTTMCEYNSKTETIFAREVTTRIFKNNNIIRFKGAIHERLLKDGQDITQAHCPDIEIFHSGYANGLVEKKSRRNIDILYDLYKKGEATTSLYYYLFRENYFLGNTDEAIKFYEIFMEQEDVDSIIQNNGAIVCVYEFMYRLMNQRPDRYVQKDIDDMLNIAYNKYPNLPIHSYLIGCDRMKIGDFVEGYKWISNAIDLNSQYTEPFTNSFTAFVNESYYTLGTIEQEHGDLEQAFSYYMEAVKGAGISLLLAVLPKLLEIVGTQPEEEIILFLNSLIDMNKKENIETLLAVLKKTRLHKVFIYYAIKYNKEFDGQDDTTYIAMILMGHAEEAVETAIEASKNLQEKTYERNWHLDYAMAGILYSKKLSMFDKFKENFNFEQKNILRAFLGGYKSENITNKTIKEYQKLYELMMYILEEDDLKNLKIMKSKREILFLPYKASMWDCLESIWKAVDEDLECECYVMPIPYYDRNKDGSLAQFHYEGKEFPEYVPITHYEDYDIKEHNPDVIYIHNPYDGYNFVTSVAPEYYSDKLKQYTDMLVYVPYFFTGGEMPEGHLNMPVYEYADKIIVQSEKALNCFTNPLIKQKIVPLGSPKADRMIWLNEHKPAVPSEWADRIVNKKVVFYNTSISGLLEFNEKALKKMRYVFDVFKNRNDIVLLWRPHPLAKATLKSMRPNLLKEYQKLEDEFLAENIGILDTTPDVNSSVAISDAYIGEDSSSVVHLFGVTGKPIFLLDIEGSELPTEEEVESAHFLDCYFEGSNAWFVCAGYNALCKMNLETGKIEVIGKLPIYSEAEFAYCDINRIGDRIIMQPLAAKEICEYDLSNNKFVVTPYKTPMPWGNFDRMIQYKNHLFFKPKAYPSILRYDVESGNIKYYYDCIRTFMQYREEENEPMFIWGVCARDNILLMASSKVNQVLEFDMETGCSKIHAVGSKGSNYFGMAYDGKDYWLIPNESKAIVRWNYETCKIVEYSDYPPNFVGEKEAFNSIVCCGKYLLAFPRTANMIVKIDIVTGEMSEVALRLPFKEGKRKSEGYKCESNYYFAKKYDDTHIVALSAYDDSLLVFDTITEACSVFKCRLNTQDKKDLSIQGIKYGFGRHGHNLPYVCRENRLYKRLDSFFDYILMENSHDNVEQKATYDKVVNNLDGSCGKRIHRNILSCLKGIV